MNLFWKITTSVWVLVASYWLITCDTQVGDMNLATKRNPSIDMWPTAVWVMWTFKWESIRILTKGQSIQCIAGNNWIPPQEWDLVNKSKITVGFSALKPWDQLTMHVGKTSGDIIIRNWEKVIAILRKGDSTRELEEFNWFYPEGTSYCNKDYWRDWIFMK